MKVLQFLLPLKPGGTLCSCGRARILIERGIKDHKPRCPENPRLTKLRS